MTAPVVPVLADVPVIGPLLSPITNAVGDAASKAGEATCRFVVDAVVGALARACARVMSELLTFMDHSSSVTFDSGWWAGARGQALFSTVLRLSAVLLLVFLLLAVVQGLLSGEPGTMLHAAAVEAPLSMFGTVALVGATTVLLGVVDAASSLVLVDAPSNLGRFASGFGTAQSVASGGLIGALLAALFLVGALLVWIELAVRASLIYFLVLLGPIALSARVWPAARGVFRKLCEMGVAIIVSKFAIALALALGAAALAGGGPPGTSGGGAGELGGQLSGLLTGATLMLVAAFTPFVVLRLVPVVEGAVVAHGISRSPMRGAMSTAQTVYYGQGLARMATGTQATRLGSAGGGATGDGPSGASPPESVPPTPSPRPGPSLRPVAPVGAGTGGGA